MADINPAAPDEHVATVSLAGPGLAAEAVEAAAAAFRTATSRVIVERALLEELGERLAALARSWPVGDPLDEATKVGPLSSQQQLDTVSCYLELAEQETARVLAGGERRAQGGYFVEPTVLAEGDRGARVPGSVRRHGRELERLARAGKVARDFFTQWKTVYLDAPLTE